MILFYAICALSIIYDLLFFEIPLIFVFFYQFIANSKHTLL